MTSLLSKKQICMEVGYMLDKFMYWLVVTIMVYYSINIGLVLGRLLWNWFELKKQDWS